MSHEKSITIGADGKFYNIPTVYKGKDYLPDEAVKNAELRSKPGGVGAGIGGLAGRLSDYLK